MGQIYTPPYNGYYYSGATPQAPIMGSGQGYYDPNVISLPNVGGYGASDGLNIGGLMGFLQQMYTEKLYLLQMRGQVPTSTGRQATSPTGRQTTPPTGGSGSSPAASRPQDQPIPPPSEVPPEEETGFQYKSFDDFLKAKEAIEYDGHKDIGNNGNGGFWDGYDDDDHTRAGGENNHTFKVDVNDDDHESGTVDDFTVEGKNNYVHFAGDNQGNRYHITGKNNLVYIDSFGKDETIDMVGDPDNFEVMGMGFNKKGRPYIIIKDEAGNQVAIQCMDDGEGHPFFNYKIKGDDGKPFIMPIESDPTTPD